MTIKELPSLLCKREAKLKQVSVGNMREIVSILSDLAYETAGMDDPFNVSFLLWQNGARRAKRAKRKKKK